MLYKKLYLSILGLICWGLYAKSGVVTVPLSEKGERRIMVVVASYNNQLYYRKNLDSIFLQKYDNYHVLYINDCSTDYTFPLVEAYVRAKKMQDKVTIINNKERKGALANHYDAIHQYCKDTDLVVNVDGDDWLINDTVFAYLNTVYSNPDVWMTYGQFTQYPSGARGWCQDMPKDIVEHNAFREYTHNAGHLRTFYAGLFKKIKKEDLIYEGNFYRMCADNAVMFPMIEMARRGHFRFIDRVLYVWNGQNNLNDHKVVKGLQQQLDGVIRSQLRYEPIETPFALDSDNLMDVAHV